MVDDFSTRCQTLNAANAKLSANNGGGGRPQWEKPFGSENQRAFLLLAERTGLEPATPDVTGRYSNQLNYHSKLV